MIHGLLPDDARRRLIAASKVGEPNTLARQRAIDAAYRWIDERYPEYLKKEE
jgi:hypothetical protein